MTDRRLRYRICMLQRESGQQTVTFRKTGTPFSLASLPTDMIPALMLAGPRSQNEDQPIGTGCSPPRPRQTAHAGVPDRH